MDFIAIISVSATEKMVDYSGQKIEWLHRNIVCKAL